MFNTSPEYNPFNSNKNLSEHMLSNFSCVRLFVTLWTDACQAPLSMGFSRERILEWVIMPSPPEDLPDSWIKSTSLTSPVLAGRFFTTSGTWEPYRYMLLSDFRDAYRGIIHCPWSHCSWIWLGNTKSILFIHSSVPSQPPSHYPNLLRRKPNSLESN